LFGVHGQQTGDQVFGRIGDIIPVRGGEIEAASLDGAVEIGGILIKEGRESAEQDVENHSNAPQVHFRSVGLATENLRSHVSRSTTCSGHLDLGELGQSEIGQLDDRIIFLGGVEQVF